ncbi:MAG TPA: polysaccharide deacetylase [Pseudonocardiaceae bacterium]|nr:polysaccharide deacetylase [Pseudonocardiaceae bacterium]
MRTRRRWGTIGLAGALGLTFLLLVVIGTVPPDGRSAPAEAAAPAPPPWLRPLAAGELPPQFVLFSFDGAGSHTHWQRVLEASRAVGAHVTGFLSGPYLLPHERRQDYTGPGHAPGDSAIGFGGSIEEVRTRIGDLNAAVEAGHEIGTHYNGHFCKGMEPSVGTWTAEQWTSELDQFFRFLHDAGGQGLRISGTMIKGGRTPCLEGRFDELLTVLGRRGMTYDASQISDGLAWPEQRHGVWQFWMPLVQIPALNNRKVIMMDYNLWYAMNRAKEDPARSAEFAAITLDTYRAAYDAAFNGNRAPLVVGNHFNDWAGGAFSSAAERFMAEVCVRPQTVCATYSEVIDWLLLQDPAVLAELSAAQ